MKKCALFRKTSPVVWAIFIFTFLSFRVFAGITVDPNGVISHGTTLTVRIAVPKNVKTVDLEIVKDEDGDGKGESHEERFLEKTPVTDGVRTGKLKDFCPAGGMIEIHLRVTSDVEPGKYVIRYTPGPGRLAEGAAVEIVARSGDFISWFKNDVMKFKGIINDPAFVLHMVKGVDNDQMKMGNLWLMNGHTYEIKSRLTNTGDCLNPCWSPDGKRVAYVRWIKNSGQLWVLTMGKEGEVSTTVRVAGNIPGNVLNPVWSHGGKEIAFLSGNDLWLVNADGSGAKTIASLDGLRKILAWSRDDRYVIFSSTPANDTPVLGEEGNLLSLGNSEIKPEDRGIWDIWKVDIRSGKRERLINDLFWQWVSYVSPDGSKLVFPVKITAAGYELWLRQGKNFKDAERLTKGQYMDVEPSWSSDGKWIVFVSNRDK